ncbi:hypothetical protein FQZ97_776610 [compost metagenome]
MFPLSPLPLGETVGFGGHYFKSLGVPALGVDLQQLVVDGHACGGAAHGLLEDLFGLKVATVGQVDVGLGNRVHVTRGVQLARRIHHG